MSAEGAPPHLVTRAEFEGRVFYVILTPGFGIGWWWSVYENGERLTTRRSFRRRPLAVQAQVIDWLEAR